METENGSGACRVCQPGGYRCGGQTPIAGDGGPHDELQILLLQDGGQAGPAAAKRRAKEAGSDSGGVGDLALSGDHFAPDGVASLEIKRGVGVGVVGNFMAADDDVARHAGQTLDVLAAHEEGGLGLVLIQQVEQAGRALTGPVVEGEGDGAYITRTVPSDGTEQGGTASADGPGSGQGTGDCEGVNGDEAFRDHANFML